MRRLSTLAFVAVVMSVAVAYALYPSIIGMARAALREDLLPSDAWYASALVALAFSGTGVVIHRRRPHLVGWVLHGIGLLWGAAQLGTILYILDGLGREIGVAGRLLAAWLGFGWAPALILMTVFLPLLFPSGRPPSRPWWWVGGTGVAALVFGFVAVTVHALTRPLDQVLASTVESGILSALMVVGPIGAMASVIVRYRRAGDVERRQVKLVTAAFIVVCVTIAFAVTPLAYQVGTHTAGQFAVTGVMCLIPVSIGLAITRYRLYEIDRIVSRTVSYTLLTALLAGLYVGAVFALQQLLRPVTGESHLAVAGATLLVAALFQPARRRVQKVVDRRFNRARYDAQRTVDAFRARLRDEVDLDELVVALVATANATVQPATAAVWLRPSASGRWPQDGPTGR